MKYLIDNINNIDENKIKYFFNTIPKNKQDKINKLINNDEKKRSIVGELLLSKLLQKNNINYDNINYYYNTYNKPYIQDCNIFFNISHSNDFVITIISNKEIGIDIEKIKKTNIKIIDKFATSKEKEYILSSKNDIEKRLFQIFTLKEAYFKRYGLGLNRVLDVEFIIKNNKVSCSDKSVKVGFINDIDNYIISYCIDK